MARTARTNRQQLVCILADDSGSMTGKRAQAATDGIRDMLKECRSRGGAGSSLFKLLLVRFGDTAEVYPGCDMASVHKIDPEAVTVKGESGSTNTAAALMLTLERLKPYVEKLRAHPEIQQHPIPLVLLFSDGEHNGSERPEPVAEQIKSLRVDGEAVVIVSAGVLIDRDSEAEKTLRAIATPDCYFQLTDMEQLRQFLAVLGSMQISGPQDIKMLMGKGNFLKPFGR